VEEEGRVECHKITAAKSHPTLFQYQMEPMVNMQVVVEVVVPEMIPKRWLEVVETEPMDLS
jgi:hypothetical protein